MSDLAGYEKEKIRRQYERKTKIKEASIRRAEEDDILEMDTKIQKLLLKKDVQLFHELVSAKKEYLESQRVSLHETSKTEWEYMSRSLALDAKIDILNDILNQPNTFRKKAVEIGNRRKGEEMT